MSDSEEERIQKSALKGEFGNCGGILRIISENAGRKSSQTQERGKKS
jgi:hypothetical protein